MDHRSRGNSSTVSRIYFAHHVCAHPAVHVRLGLPWLCENSETRNCDRTNISSRPRVQCAKIERVFSSDLSEKNILVAFQFFAFLHTQGQSRQGAARCRSSDVRNAPLATVGLKKAVCRDGPLTVIDHRRSACCLKPAMVG
jgi:hypothetical protein